ncbi:MAG TPA: hypothetical protein VHF22_02910, partial [Planctomycetota bacterium]|nr:hypothetical protein [Planctomycetota bacterium]
ETDTGQWTQEEQDKIAKALEQQGQASDGLKKLIEEVESQAQSSSGGGGSKQRQEQRQQQRGGQQNQQMRERQQEETKRPQDPQRDKSEQQKQKGQREKSAQDPAQNDQKSKGEPQGADYKLDKSKQGSPGEKWGDLPPKARRELMESTRREPPVQWRKQIEDYFRKLAEPKGAPNR